ncbi:unnamed protein product [marine sediment metagenome]|uniref:Uncharacterized protein n=1 Tax=marine sediment metagenome TaxID=412755 RepID=X0ZEI3_9ZZZZ
MKYRIGISLTLFLLISMLFMPLAVSADDGKSIIKEMVQAPADYSVGLIISPYAIFEIDRFIMSGYGDIDGRLFMYPNWVFLRIF